MTRAALVIGAVLILGLAVFSVWRPDRDEPQSQAAPSTTRVAPATTETPVSTTIRATTTSSPTPTTAETIFRSSVDVVTAEDLYASWRPGCPLDVDELRGVNVLHWGFDGEPHTGRLIVAESLTDDVIAIMEDLFEAGFPIERMEPIDRYDGDDDRSMAANNTSAFNCRPVTGGSSWSEHSYGRAIDVNPLLNPYVRGGTVLPIDGARYADRDLDIPGMIHPGDEVVDAFAARGWAWGGSWSGTKDYQHFSTTGR
jgi:hypothetical protein